VRTGEDSNAVTCDSCFQVQSAIAQSTATCEPPSLAWGMPRSADRAAISRICPAIDLLFRLTGAVVCSIGVIGSGSEFAIRKSALFGRDGAGGSATHRPPRGAMCESWRVSSGTQPRAAVGDGGQRLWDDRQARPDKELRAGCPGNGPKFRESRSPHTPSEPGTLRRVSRKRGRWPADAGNAARTSADRAFPMHRVARRLLSPRCARWRTGL